MKEPTPELIKKHPSLKRLKGERTNTWLKRTTYMMQGAERSLSKVAKELLNLRESDENYKKVISSLETLSADKQFDMYAHLYDVEEQTIKLKKTVEKGEELEDIELKMLEALIKSLSNFIGDFIKNPVKQDGGEYSLMSKADLYLKILNAFEKADTLLCRLTGKPKEYTENHHKVEQETILLTEESVFDGLAEIDDELSDIYETRQDTVTETE